MFTGAVLLDGMSALSVSVALIVIVCMTAAFSILLAVYSSNKRKLINSGGEDNSIRAELEKGYEKYKKSGKGDGSVRSYMTVREKSERVYNFVMNVIFGIVMAAVLALAVTGIVYKVNNRQLFMGKTAYLTIQTGSMSEKNPDNEYYTFLPDNQIPQYALIGIDKVSEDDLKLYDIVAFEHNGVTYVHRIVGIGEGANGKLFTTAGDNNVGSMPFEILMSFDKIIGVYNGYNSVGLGSLLSYLQSEIGLVALAFALILVLVTDIAESSTTKTYKKRYAYVADLLEHPVVEETPVALETAEEPPVAEEQPQAEEPAPQAAEEVLPAESVQPVPEETAVVAAEQTAVQPEPQAEVCEEDAEEEVAVVYEKTDFGFLAVREKKGFIARLVEGSEENRAAYLEIKREIMSYVGVKSRIGWKGENFKYAKKLIISMKIRGKTLCLFLAVDPAKYAEGKIRVDDLGESGGALPSMYKINGKRKTGYAKEIIAKMMAELGATRGEVKEENYLAEYEKLTHEELIERGFIRRVKTTVLQPEKAPEEKPAESVPPVSEEPAQAEEVAVTEAVAETAEVEAQPEPQAEIAAEVEEETAAVYAEEDDAVVEQTVREKSGFIARLVEGSEENRAAYIEIKKEIMSYGGVKSRVGWKGDNFKYGKKQIISLKIRGKTLCMFLAVDPAKYPEGKIRVEDLGESGGGFSSVYRINGKRKTGYAKKIIAGLMAELGATRGKVKEQNYLGEYENLTHEELIERGLIREVKDSSFDALKTRKGNKAKNKPAEKTEEIETVAETEATTEKPKYGDGQ